MQVKSLEKFDVFFDSWVSEKTLRQQGVVEEVLSYLAEADCTYEKEDAIWFCSSKFGDDKDRVLMKADGSITYFVPDLAYHLTKYQRSFDVMIDVLGPDHHGYVPRLKAAIKALKYPEEKLEIIFLQQVNLFESGEKVKMSKRLGKIVTMDDLIDYVGKDAARYFFIDRRPNSHLNFDIELAKKQTSENPVYYCQYAHARICSILKKAKKDKIALKELDAEMLKKLSKAEELTIIKKLLEFPSLLVSIANTREPHRLAGYAYELAGMFHRYYAKYVIVNKKSLVLSMARMYLIMSVKNVLGICFRLMGISAPEKM
jgi:arginyl-tRNA synthetase